MLHAEYIRDMHSNFVVLKGIEGKTTSYGSRMILHNNIPGLLKMELRSIDNMDLFYYDVTSKKSLAAVWENKSLNYYELKHIVTDILKTLQKSEDYLLSENDFIIDPNYIFLDTDSQNILLCHLVGRDENMKEQLNRLMEYLMNKVDYKDEAAVVLIYALYKESKETDCTFEKLLKEINKKDNDPKVRKINIEEIENMEQSQKNAFQKPSIQYPDNKKTPKWNPVKKKSENQKVHNNKDQNQKKQNQLKHNQMKQNNQKLMSQNIKSQKAKSQNGGNQSEKSPNTQNQNIDNLTRKGLNQKNLNNRTQKPGYQSPGHQNITALTEKIQACLGNFINKHIVKSTDLPAPPLKNQSDKEEVESEREVQYFGPRTFILAGVSIIAGIVILIIALQFNLLDNTFGTHIDSIKLLSGLIILVCMEAYVFMKLFGSKNKLTRIKTKVEYVDIETEYADNETEYTDNKTEYADVKTEYADVKTEYADVKTEYTDVKKEYADIEPEYAEADANKGIIWKGGRCFDDKDSQAQETTKLLWQESSNDEVENTVILSQLQPWKQYHLTRLDKEIQMVIPVNHFPFLIGKLKKEMDLLIEDSSVSRRHAQFTKEGEDIFLTDLYSTNGTYINGMRLTVNKPYLLNEKDEIVFSQVKYVWTVLTREK
jgi:hypothetical protein